MKSFSLVFILSFFLQNSFGQFLTKSEAYILADRLLEVEILSERGRNMLKMQIDQEKLERMKREDLVKGTFSTTKEPLPSNILQFCAGVAGNDFYFRTGIIEQNIIVDQLLFERNSKRSNPIKEEEYEKLYKIAKERMVDFEGFKIEQNIPVLDTLPGDFAYSISPFSIPNFGEEAKLIHEKRSVVGKNRTKTLNDLLEIGLITEVIYKEILPKIKSNELYLEALVFSEAARRAAFYEDFDEMRQNEIEFLKRLKYEGIVSNENYEEAIESYDLFDLKGKYGLVPFCNNALVFKLKSYPNDPQVSYRIIYNEIKSIVPNFDFDNFSCEIIEGETWDENTTELRAQIKFEVDEVAYSNTIFYDYKTIVNQDSFYFMKREIDTTLKIGEEVAGDFVSGVNQFLTDQNSSQRLYLSRPIPNDDELLESEISVILMTKDQAKIWGKGSSEFYISSPSHENIFTTKNTNAFIRQYQEIGLFDHLIKEEVELGKRCVSEKNINSYIRILECFPNMIYISGDGESAFNSPYKRMALTLSKYSKGQFLPTEIIDEFDVSSDQEKTKFSFVFKGKKYEKKLKIRRDWEDYTAMELIFQAIKESEIDGRFYYVDDHVYLAGYIYLSDRQYNFLKKEQPDLFLTFDEYLKKND